MALSDRSLTCNECGTSFTFSVDEQEFFASRGYVNEPKRCPSCRAARRSQQRGGRYPREMHPVVCAECGTETTVPFQPTGERPVYCSDCFNRQRSSSV